MRIILTSSLSSMSELHEANCILNTLLAYTELYKKAQKRTWETIRPELHECGFIYCKHSHFFLPALHNGNPTMSCFSTIWTPDSDRKTLLMFFSRWSKKHKANVCHQDRKLETLPSAAFYPLRNLPQCKAALRLRMKTQAKLRTSILLSLKPPSEHGCPGNAPLPGDLSKL